MTAPRERVCDQCGRWIDKGEILYEMRISLVAEPGPVIDLELPPADADLRREMEALIARMEAMSDEARQEASDQVFEEYSLVLCPDCRQLVHHQIKRRRALFGPDPEDQENSR
ncbi:hypothetical protein GC173_12095 [bacterium]|nr:hypothetical protein [bacterium]